MRSNLILFSVLFSSSLPSLVDCFLVAMAPVSVSMSPTGDFLATTHVDSLGVYLWSEPISSQYLVKVVIVVELAPIIRY